MTSLVAHEQFVSDNPEYARYDVDGRELHCDGMLHVDAELSDRLWVIVCDRCPFELGIHPRLLERALSGPRPVAPADRTIESGASW